MLKVILIASVLLLSGCGTFTPMPTHGGGKRFAIEQKLISAATKKAIADLPVAELRGKKGFLSISVIFDEGGGSVNGGRPYATEILSSISKNLVTRSNPAEEPGQKSRERSRTDEAGISVARGESLYGKDVGFNSSDARHLNNLFSSYLHRNNIQKDPDPDLDGEADFLLEIIVDVFGTIWSRTDWAAKNSDKLSAVISYEYVITPLKDEHKALAKVGSISYVATYLETYLFWLGPVETNFSVIKDDTAAIIGDLGVVVDHSNNPYSKRNPAEFITPSPSPIQINPAAR